MAEQKPAEPPPPPPPPPTPPPKETESQSETYSRIAFDKSRKSFKGE